VTVDRSDLQDSDSSDVVYLKTYTLPSQGPGARDVEVTLGLSRSRAVDPRLGRTLTPIYRHPSLTLPHSVNPYSSGQLLLVSLRLGHLSFSEGCQVHGSSPVVVQVFTRVLQSGEGPGLSCEGSVVMKPFCLW
jgi:hypothetical protein